MIFSPLEVAEQLDMMASRRKSEKDAELRGLMRQAEKHLRDLSATVKSRPLTEDEVRLMASCTDRSVELCAYVEDRRYYKPVPAIITRMVGDGIRAVYSSGMYDVLELKNYNRTWRLWAKYPSGVDMKMMDWRPKK